MRLLIRRDSSAYICTLAFLPALSKSRTSCYMYMTLANQANSTKLLSEETQIPVIIKGGAVRGTKEVGSS